MKVRQTPIAMAIAMALTGMVSPASAQQSDAATPDAPAKDKVPQVQEITVTGIRAAHQQSLNQKRNADSVMDVITAEDIGKLPDKNVADAVERIPGVNISSGSGGQGGFSENDRVSIRGTSPSLTQTMVNGHSISTGDWYIGDQAGTVGRSVSFTLLPSEIVGSVEVQKSSQADYVEGGVVGNVNIVTRTPLSFKKQLTLEATLQALYADLPKTTDPQFNALVNWNNDSRTMGVLFQAFSENRHERRDGQEFLGYSTVDPAGAVAAAHPDLANVVYPTQIGSALFTQHSKRQGGLFDIELKPSKELSLNANGFYSHLNATNLDTNFMANPVSLLDPGVSPTSYTVRNGTLVSAIFPVTTYDPNDPNPMGPTYPGLRDEIYRPNAGSSAAYLDLSAKYRVSDALTITGKIGDTRGIGETPHDYGHESFLINSGLQYQMNGRSGPAIVSFPGVDTTNFNNPANVTEGGSWSASTKVTDQEVYAQADAELALNSGIWESAKFGLRTAHHKRSALTYNFGCFSDPQSACDLSTMPSPVWNGTTSPSNFGSAIGFGPGFLSHFWRLEPGALQAWQEQNLSAAQGPNYQGNFNIDEKDSAAYAMANLAGEHWRGNIGVRVVKTKQTGSAFDLVDQDTNTYAPVESRHNYTDVLPSTNFRFDLSRELVARVAVSKTMARADYSALSPAVTLNNIDLTGGGGNADLDAVRSTNYDATIEWYFAPQSLLSFGVFYMDMPSYVTFGNHTQTYFNTSTSTYTPFIITSPFNIAAKNKGFEIAYQQPFGGGFGGLVNYSYSDGHSADGATLVGSSKNTANIEGYFENAAFSARLAYTYRSAFLVGLANAVPENAAAVGSLAGSINYKINDHLTLTCDALNLNNSKLKYYGANVDQPVAFYSSGRQFYVGVRVSM